METNVQQTTNNRIKSERGQTMTEFAFVLPILLVLLFGIVQFGVIFNNYVTLTDAARSGARKAVVSRNSSDPVGDCVNQVRNASSNLNQSDLQVSCSSSWQPGSDVTVTASYPYDISLLGWVVANGRLNTTMKERVE
jgi:Flp pilus assembly protein TadG